VLNLLGAYGGWAARLADEPARLSFRQPGFKDVEDWRRVARARFRDALLLPDVGPAPHASLQKRVSHDGLDVELLSWQLPYGPPTEALFLKPAGARGPLPGVLALHDHAGDKCFGARKVAHLGDDLSPHLRRHRERYYGGVSWANELARRGYAVLAHDVFPFASRRVRASDLPDALNPDRVSDGIDAETGIARYNRLAAAHEPVIAKGLLCAGTTLSGVVAAEDQAALDVLRSRPEVDEARVGCCGLSGGGLRAAYLAGLDARVGCTCCVGILTTWRDLLLHKAHKHSWTVYVPGLPRDLDLPEVLALTAPNPALVLNNRDDALLSGAEMERAHRILASIGASREASAANAGRRLDPTAVAVVRTRKSRRPIPLVPAIAAGAPPDCAYSGNDRPRGVTCQTHFRRSALS
jgi:dienelactone hydrolase